MMTCCKIDGLIKMTMVIYKSYILIKTSKYFVKCTVKTLQTSACCFYIFPSLLINIILMQPHMICDYKTEVHHNKIVLQFLL